MEHFVVQRGVMALHAMLEERLAVIGRYENDRVVPSPFRPQCVEDLAHRIIRHPQVPVVESDHLSDIGRIQCLSRSRVHLTYQ